MTSSFQHQGGCLTEEGVAAVKNAPIGKAPTELVQHLKLCSICQRRVLAEDAPFQAKRANPPNVARTALFVGVILLMAFFALMTMMRLRS